MIEHCPQFSEQINLIIEGANKQISGIRKQMSAKESF
jgi:hypothetical protein